MVIPKYFSNDGTSDDSDEDFNIKPSMVRKRQDWQKKSLKPFIRSQKHGGGKVAQLVERQNSYVSTTTATSNSTQTDLGDMLPDPRSSDGSIQVLEAQDAVQNFTHILTAKSPHKTHTTVCADEPFLSSDDDMPASPNKKSFLEATLYDGKNDDPDVESGHLRIGEASFTMSIGKESKSDLESQKATVSKFHSETGSTTALESPPIPEEFVTENSTEADSDFTGLSSSTTLPAAAIQIMAKSLADLSTISSIGSKSSAEQSPSFIADDVKVSEKNLADEYANIITAAEPSSEQAASSISDDVKVSEKSLAVESANSFITARASSEQSPSSIVDDAKVTEKSPADESASSYNAAKSSSEQASSPFAGVENVSDKSLAEGSANSFISSKPSAAQTPSPIADGIVVENNLTDITSQPKSPAPTSETEMEPASAVESPVIPEVFVAENSTKADSDLTSLSSNTTFSAAAMQIMEKSLADISTISSKPSAEQTPSPIADDVKISDKSPADDSAHIFISSKSSAEQVVSPIADAVKVSEKNLADKSANSFVAAKASSEQTVRPSPIVCVEKATESSLAEEPGNSTSSGRDTKRSKRSSRSSGSHRSPRKERKSLSKSHQSRSRDGRSPSRNRSSVSSKPSTRKVDSIIADAEKVPEKRPSGRSTKKSVSSTSSGRDTKRSKRSSRSSGSHRSPRKERKLLSKSHRSSGRDDKSHSSRHRKTSPNRDNSLSRNRSRVSSRALSEQVSSTVADAENVSEKSLANEPTSTSLGSNIDTELIDVSAGKESTPSGVADIATTDEEPTFAETTELSASRDTTAALRDYEFAASNRNDEVEEDAIFDDVEVATRKISELSPKTEPNVRQLAYVAVPLNPALRNVLSKGPNQDIYSIPGKKEEDEEVQLVPASASMKLDSLKDVVGETSTACASSDFEGDSTIGSGSDDPDESNDITPEAVAADQKKSGEAEGAASRSKSVFLIFFACVFAAVVAVPLPFFIDFTASAGAVIETTSPSVSAVPSSPPSLSQAPSDNPSSNPSIYPTISSMPTIAPSGHPTVSIYPSLVPTLSNAPTPAPSILPTESIEPSENPSEAPSINPSSNPSGSPSSSPTVSRAPSSPPSSSPSVSPSATPSQSPTRTFGPSSRPSPSPTREPTNSPTDFPTRMPTTPQPSRRPTPPPSELVNAFKIRLYWSPDYFWQETKQETWWCMECVKCNEYGGKDGPDHGCASYGTGDESRCQAGDSLWIRDCRGRGNRFNIENSAGNGSMLRIARTNLCVERIRTNHPYLFIQGCDRNNPYQRFNSWNNNNKFELRPAGSNDCISQAHHPKSGELLAMHNCDLAQRDETLFWERY